VYDGWASKHANWVLVPLRLAVILLAMIEGGMQNICV
jgi:hypothetical protein